ncbi:MAG: TSUP family transporter [Deltaproteobacteria bacterium]|jgi:uncharacterized membrane protein YfcA|nr:TSUP family transporter [Deltaproteobacteria bacterium]
MELELWIVVLVGLAFFAAGFIDSIAGGGGLISVPAFLLTGVQPELVLGTSKMAASLGTASSLVTYARSGLVIWRMALCGIPACLVGAFLGSKAILHFDSGTIGKLMLVLLPIGALVTLMPKKSAAVSKGSADLRPRDLYLYNPLVCLALGFYDGFFGPGTGSFFIIAYHFFLKIGMVQASATAKVFNLATTFCSFVVFALGGHVLYLLAVPLAAANMVGNVVGSRMAIRIGAGFVRRILYVSLSLLFVSLIYKFFIE